MTTTIIARKPSIVCTREQTSEYYLTAFLGNWSPTLIPFSYEIGSSSTAPPPKSGRKSGFSRPKSFRNPNCNWVANDDLPGFIVEKPFATEEEEANNANAVKGKYMVFYLFSYRCSYDYHAVDEVAYLCPLMWYEVSSSSSNIIFLCSKWDQVSHQRSINASRGTFHA